MLRQYLSSAVYKVGSLRSAICLLAADVYTMGGQGGGPRRAVRPPIDT